jgi:hypothetical protein
MTSFAEVQQVGSLFASLPCRWFVCGGWALDLFLNRVTRTHKDVDIAIARNDQLIVRDYLRRRGWGFERVVNGALAPWADDEWLTLPAHAIWCKNDGHTPGFVELLLNEIEGEQFRFRRDQSITLARGRMSFQSLSGLPALAPEIVLLYKSNDPEDSEADFQNTVESLSGESRNWLKSALHVLFARHAWADRL